MKNATLIPSSEFGKWALAFGVLLVSLNVLNDFGGGELAEALALSIAFGATIALGPKAFANLGLATTAQGGN